MTGTGKNLTDRVRDRLSWCLRGGLATAAALSLLACDSGSSGADGVDPGVIEVPIAYIKRPIPVDDDGDPIQADLRDPTLFSAGGNVFLQSSSDAGSGVRNISRSIIGTTGDARGLAANYEGDKLLFSLRLEDPDENDDIVPRWNIYEYDLVTGQLRPVIDNVVAAELGDDLYPAYLPDGRIVFSSNRQSQAREMQSNEGKSQYSALTEDERVLALTLHVMNDDGSGIRQISFNQSHDLFPQVLSDTYPGKILFSRWDNAVNSRGIHLYTVNPDGSDLELLYGANSHDTGFNGANVQFSRPRELPNGDFAAITRTFSGTFDGGDIVTIDADRFADIDVPVWRLAGLAGPAQRPATVNGIRDDGGLSLAGRYGAFFPLWDGSDRLLVSKSACQLDVDGVRRPCIEPYLSDANAEEASPEYSLWIYDLDNDTERPLVLAQPGQVVTDVIALETRLPKPPVIFDKSTDNGQLVARWYDDLVGVVNIRSVYDLGDGQPFDGSFFGVTGSAANIDDVQDFADPSVVSASDRPARFVRFTKNVGLPDPDDPAGVDLDGAAFGPSRRRGMREILGYAPVEPDGSVKVLVPANVPLAVEVLDAAGRRIGPEHRAWFQVQPGDTVSCIGCHTPGTQNTEIHARSDAMAPSFNSGLAGLEYTNTLMPGQGIAYFGEPGQTMAEVRFDRYFQINGVERDPRLSPNIRLEDYWTDPASGTPDPAVPIDLRYADLTASPSPENPFCGPPADFNCRVIINYADHIAPIWLLDRGPAADPDAIMVQPPDPVPPNDDPTNTPLNFVDVTGVGDGIGDWTCTECHSTKGGTQIAYGQLELDVDPNAIAGDFPRAYRELFFADQGQFFDGMMVDDFFVLVDDGTGTGTFVEQDDPAAGVAPSMTVAGARRSYFFEKMTGTELEAGRALSGGYDHSAMLTPAELKLIAEWIEIGAQNFNDPFDPDAPQN